MDISTYSTANNSSTSVHIIAVDIFPGETLEHISLSTSEIEVPNITRMELELIVLSILFLITRLFKVDLILISLSR